MTSRRNFLKTTAIAGAATLSGIASCSLPGRKKSLQNITIQSVGSNYEREPLIRPFGFKGGYMTEIWQTANFIKSASGIEKVGLCTQNVLWSDASVFSSHSEYEGNELMYALTKHALQLIEGRSFNNPIELIDEIVEQLR